MKQRNKILIASFFIGLFVGVLASAQPGDAAAAKKGEEIFGRRCTGCHGLDEVRVGPHLRGVFGKPAGSDPNFPYSAALKGSGVKWDETALDKWLTDTDSLIPDNDMSFRLANAEERGAIITYLKSLRAK